MATKARQQYFADEDSLQKKSREFSIADEIQQKIDSVEEWAQVNVIETVKVNWTALVPDANKAVNIDVPEVIDNLYTVAADDALSAKQWKLLYDYIQNLQTIGRFLSNWDTATWLPITNPSESPYQYKAWDYYRVSNVAVSPASNYRPDGSSYTIWVASTTVETLYVAVSDLYLYDGTDWILLSNSWSGIAVDSSLSTTSTNPVENRVITNALNWKHPWAISNVAPSNPVEWMLWYDTVNDELKTYNWTAWQTEWTKMVVLEYGVSTWQDFIDAYNENAIVYCKVSSWSSGYRMAFMAYTAWQWTPTEVEFQYYRSRSSHSQSSTQLDEVYVYKLTNAWVWTTTQRDTWAEMIAGTWIWITFNSSGATINNSWVTSVNWNTWAVTVEEVPSWWTEWQVLTQTNNWPAWQNPTIWAEIEYVTQAEYNALPSSKLTDWKHYVIYTSDSPTPPTPWQPWANTLAYWKLNWDLNDSSGNNRNLTNAWWLTFATVDGVECAYYDWVWTGDCYAYCQTLPTPSVITINIWAKANNSWTWSYARWLFHTNCYNSRPNEWVRWEYYSGSLFPNVLVWSWFDFNDIVYNWIDYNSIRDKWCLWTVVYDNTTYKVDIYFNGQSYGSSTFSTYHPSGNWCWFFTLWTGFNATDSWISRKWYGWISDSIIEDKARTAQEVADYFNQTKWDYWIS